MNVRLYHLAAWSCLAAAACSGGASPTRPSAMVAPSPSAISIEAETGSGDGQVRQRTQASGGQTVHLGPGERRWWTLTVTAAQVDYALAVRYANGKEGENETLTVTVDGTVAGSFLDRDSGDSIEGWNTFITDPAGTSTVRAGAHTIALEVSGGDGCVEIDLVTLTPQ